MKSILYHKKICRLMLRVFFSKLIIIAPMIIAMLFSFNLTAQTRVLKGKLINEQGEPVSSASVTLKGSTIAVTTDAAGSFTLQTTGTNNILVISCIGYEQTEYPVQSIGEPLIITLKSASKELAEVELVSSGYQDIPKERATGSFVKIDNATLNQQVGTNILQRLDGVTSGLLFNIGKQNSNPQNRTNISIRGLSTINGPLDPLIVLDGFIYEGNIQNINPNDVDNITVLKDAAATSIWGARAGNGVIIINTKKGAFNQRLQIGASANVIFSQEPDLFSLPQMSSASYIDVEQMLFNEGYFNSQINGSPLLALTPAVEIFLKAKKGLLSPADSALQIDALKQVDSRNEYLRHFYTGAATQQYAVNVKGGSKNNTYFFSAAFDKSMNEMYSNFRKLNIKIANSFKPTKNILLNMSVYYTNSRSEAGRGLAYNSLTVNGRQVPYLQFADADGNPVSFAPTLNNNYTDTAGGGMLFNWKYFPLEDYKYNKTTGSTGELYAMGSLQYNLFKFLNLDISYQYQQQQIETEQINELESFKTRSFINLFTQIDRTTGMVNYGVPAGAIKSMEIGSIKSNTGRAQLNYTHERNDHSIYAILGTEIRQSASTGNAYTIYGYNYDPLSYSNVDFVNPYPISISGAYDYIPGSPVFSPVQTNRFVSLYGNGSYTYKNRYTISASARKDGSNIFGLNTNDKWKPLWSIGGAWKISRESFFRAPAFSSLGIRVTYGYSGNVDLSKSAMAVARYNSGSTVTNLPSAQIVTINNPDLRWEQVGVFNMGVDFSLMNNLLSGSIEYYMKKGMDLYGLTPYDYTTWGATRSITRNVADMSGRGIDLVLNSKNIDRGLKWTSTLLFNYNSAKTTRYETASATRISALLGGGSGIFPVIGKPLYAIAAYKWGGLDNAGNPQGYVNGHLSTDYTAIVDEGLTKGVEGNIAYVGPANPTVFGSVINSLSWKGFTLSANISYRFGYYFRKSSISYTGLVATNAGHKDFESRWQHTGDEAYTHIPSFIYPTDENRDNFYSLSSINILKGDHVRLQYLNLAYTFNKMDYPKTAFKEIQLYINAANLGILWRANKENIDPDYPTALSPVKSIAFGVRANF